MEHFGFGIFESYFVWCCYGKKVFLDATSNHLDCLFSTCDSVIVAEYLKEMFQRWQEIEDLSNVYSSLIWVIPDNNVTAAVTNHV